MKCIIPLAGPDLYSAQRGLRPLHELPDGRALLVAALETRAWRPQMEGEDYIFVVREVAALQTLRNALHASWPGCQVVTISHPSEGALLSALAGVALAANGAPLCIDLADILFKGPENFWSDWAPEFGAATPCFISSDPAYSYLRFKGDHVVEAAEKRVISDYASAGVYFFRDSSIFLEAAAHSLRHREALSFKGALFVCPTMNGVLAQGLKVAAPLVQEPVPIGKMFHQPNS